MIDNDTLIDGNIGAALFQLILSVVTWNLGFKSVSYWCLGWSIVSCLLALYYLYSGDEI